MFIKNTLMVALATGLVLSCSRSEPEHAAAEPTATAAPPPAPEAAPADPTVVDPAHYKTEFENDRVRIVRITYGPNEGSVMHYHPDNVAVFLTDNTAEMTLPGGDTVEISLKAGQAMFEAAGEHLPKNTSDQPLEVVLVELKDAGSPPSAAAGPDPTQVDADHYTTEFDNDRVRVVRIAYGPGEESVMHYHPDSVAVFLTDHRVQMTGPDGETSQIGASAGEAIFMPAGQHLPKNISESAWELLLVELK